MGPIIYPSVHCKPINRPSQHQHCIGLPYLLTLHPVTLEQNGQNLDYSPRKNRHRHSSILKPFSLTLPLCWLRVSAFCSALKFVHDGDKKDVDEDGYKSAILERWKSSQRGRESCRECLHQENGAGEIGEACSQGP